MHLAKKEEKVKMEYIMVDPPEGWKFGFPKKAPNNMNSEQFNIWLIENSYPEKLINELGEHFYVRCWEARNED